LKGLWRAQRLHSWSIWIANVLGTLSFSLDVIYYSWAAATWAISGSGAVRAACSWWFRKARSSSSCFELVSREAEWAGFNGLFGSPFAWLMNHSYNCSLFFSESYHHRHYHFGGSIVDPVCRWLVFSCTNPACSLMIWWSLGVFYQIIPA